MALYSEALNNEMAYITTMKYVGTAGTRYSGDYSLYRAAPDIAPDIAMIWPLFHTWYAIAMMSKKLRSPSSANTYTNACTDTR